jgi:hypothetical protein
MPPVSSGSDPSIRVLPLTSDRPEPDIRGGCLYMTACIHFTISKCSPLTAGVSNLKGVASPTSAERTAALLRVSTASQRASGAKNCPSRADDSHLGWIEYQQAHLHRVPVDDACRHITCRGETQGLRNWQDTKAGHPALAYASTSRRDTKLQDMAKLSHAQQNPGACDCVGALRQNVVEVRDSSHQS